MKKQYHVFLSVLLFSTLASSFFTAGIHKEENTRVLASADPCTDCGKQAALEAHKQALENTPEKLLEKLITNAKKDDLIPLWEKLEDLYNNGMDEELVEKLKLKLIKRIRELVLKEKEFDDQNELLKMMVSFAGKDQNSQEFASLALQEFVDVVYNIDSSRFSSKQFSDLLDTVSLAEEVYTDDDTEELVKTLYSEMKEEKKLRRQDEVSEASGKIAEMQKSVSDYCYNSDAKERRKNISKCSSAKRQLRVAQKNYQKMVQEQQKELEREYQKTQAMAWQAMGMWNYNPYMNNMYTPYSYNPYYYNPYSYYNSYAYNPYRYYAPYNPYGMNNNWGNF